MTLPPQEREDLRAEGTAAHERAEMVTDDTERNRTILEIASWVQDMQGAIIDGLGEGWRARSEVCSAITRRLLDSVSRSPASDHITTPKD